MTFRSLLILPATATLLVLHSVVAYAEAPTPDIPEVNGFVPTQMEDVEEPHPLTNRVIVAEPVANTYGTAEITYPIDIPAGRNGLQPNIDLTYSSSNGASVFGYGWTMQQPAITIDTRWGVPRYDSRYETEIYMLNGTQIVQKDGNPELTLPYQTHTQQQRRNGNVSFMSRDTKNKDVITRHGNSPRNYWWSVVDRNGTTYYYGKYHADSQTNITCVLTDATGNIGYWALAEVVDLHGNYIRYEYDKDEGTDIFLTNIYYTGHRDAQGETNVLPPYRIRLHYNDQYPDSLQSDCRLGFIRKIDRKVCYIEESHRGYSSEVNYIPFIRYSLKISKNMNDASPKQYLYSVKSYRMKGIEGQCYENSISGQYTCFYPEECSESNDYLLGVTDFTYSNSTSVFDVREHIIINSDDEHTNLSEARSIDWSLGGTLSIGVGSDAWNTNISAGGNYDFSTSKGDVGMTLMDMNGDGLTDKVYIKNDSIYYRKQIQLDTICFFSQEQNTGIPARSLNHEVSKTNRWGLQAGAAVPGEYAGANISGGWSVTNTQTSRYFADVNGDGLPDYIDDGTVYFNRLNSQSDFHKHQNENQVVVDSSSCAPYFYYDGQVNSSIDCRTDTVLIDSYTATGQCLNYYSYNPDCAILCQEYIDGNDDVWEWCEECLSTTPVYLDDEYNIITTVDNNFCNNNSEYYQLIGATRLCPECFMYLTDQYGRDIDTYIDCATSCQVDDATLYWDLRGCCYSSDDCPTEECLNYSRDVRSDCEDVCVNGYEVCEDCVDACQHGAYDCNECQRTYGCHGAIESSYAHEICSYYGYTDCACVNALYSTGGICDECLEICKFHPELCYSCINRNCEYISSEDIAAQQIYDWKQAIRASHPNALFIQNGWTVTAYDTLTVCSPPEELIPNIEAVRVWVAPRDGLILIRSDIQLLADASIERIQSRSADGVRCVIQHDKQVQVVSMPTKHLSPTTTSIIDNINISATDYSVHEKRYDSIVVSKGDVLSFHVISKSSHSFDNVDWSQHISYHYYGINSDSNHDFICSSKESIQCDTIGSAKVEFWADLQSGGSALVEIKKSNTTYASYNVSSSQNTYVCCNINTIWPNDFNTLHLTLNSPYPSKARVRSKITFYRGFNPNDTVIKWLVPEVIFPRNSDEIHDDVYYDLFGPLYRGWGQYGFNNKYGTTIIPLDSLYNPIKKIYEGHHNDTASYRDSIQSMAGMDTTLLMESPESIEIAFEQKDLLNPLGMMWIEMHADARNYQWEAYGKIARVGQTVMSNTRDESQQASAASATVVNNGDFDFYDNAVPKSTNGTRIMTIRKESKTKQWDLAFGANVVCAGVGRSKSNGTYQLLSDYMDMNGDRYPDIIRKSSIQYTKPWGGLGETLTTDACSHETKTATEGVTFSGNYGKTVKQPGSMKNDRFMTSASGSVNVGRTYSNSEASLILQDVNADGLPDKLVINDDTTFIYLNYGYKFELFIIIPGIDKLTSTHSEATSRNVGFSASNYWGEAVEQLFSSANEATHSKKSMYQASISAGCSSSASVNTTMARLIDINGDGRLDFVQYDPTGLWVVGDILNIYYTDPKQIGDSLLQRSITSNAGLNLALTGGYTFWGVMKVCAGVQTTPINISETFGTHDLIDMNGDGLPDLVRVANNKMYVRYNISGKRGLLASVKNLYRNRIDLDYTLSQPTSGQPYRQMLLTSVRNIDENATADVGVPVMEKRISYADPHYDPSERQSYGYGSVTTYDMYPATNDDTARIYRKHVQRYQNQEYAEHGKLIYDAVLDSLDNLYTEYELGTVYFDASGNETDNTCQDIKIRVGKEAHITRYYEGTAEPITTAKIYDYDNYHNVTRYEDLGDSLITNDDLLTTITYENRAQYVNRNLISLPTDVLVTAAGQNIRKTRSEYTAEGKLSKQVLSSLINGSDSCVTDYLYNDFGLLSHVTLPPNQNNQRGTISITYDSFMYILPQKITNHFGQTQRYTYSTHWQKPLQVISPAGDTISYEYDSYGRLTTVTAPFERNADRYSVKYTYGTIDYYNNNIYVDAKTYTEGDSTLQRSLYDSRGLLLQRQKRRGSNYIVTDRHSYDCFGRLIKTYSPTTANNLSNSYISQNRQLVASYTYDILDRQTSVHWNDASHNVSTTQYTLGNDHQGIRRFKTLLTDENNHQWQTYTSPQGWVTTTVAPDNATTRFVHDALGQLISSTDPDSMTTTHTYDGLGRHIQRIHPDAGIDRWQYDPAGNIIARQAQCQYVFSQHTTNYHYKYDRLDSICYSFHPEMNVAYTYDSVSGRLLQRSDLTGKERFKYDALGNVTESRRQIVMPNETYAYTFLTRYKYDSFGKMREITYPDGEVVSYTYRDGLLKGMQGTHFNRTINYISDITYTNDDKMQVINYGNGVVNSFSYDSVRKWIASGYLHVPEMCDYEDRTYSYDGVGNITGIAQDVPWRESVLGGTYTTSYTYDVQNRLIAASQQSSSLGAYSYAMTYSPAGCIGQKQCAATNTNLTYAYRKDNNNRRVNHQIAGICEGQIMDITRLNWDGEGRLRSMYGSCFEGLRQNKWNEAGQLVASYTDDEGAYFGYDGNGERVYKLRCNVSVEQLNAGMQHVMLWFTSSTLYVNPYLVVTPQGYTKYYYFGTNRAAAQHGSISHLQAQFNQSDTVAALINKANTFMGAMIGNVALYVADDEPLISISGSPILSDLSPRCNSLSRSISTTSLQNLLLPVISGDVHALECDPLQPARYFYHADHLGSATWITDSVGDAAQFLQYLPYGEIWLNRNCGYDERYKFTGKERDVETGYDYFGARYYTSAISGWLSPDPLMDKYPNISPYAYCHLNPLRNIDLDGRDDLFDEGGYYLRHVDNGTDYVLIENSKGLPQNITDFLYGKDSKDNRAMLQNVATYYAHQVGLNQNIGISDNITENAAFAATNPNTRQVYITVIDGKISSYANTSNNIMNAFVHEQYHAETGIVGNIAEVEAIVRQISHPTWRLTTSAFQKGIVNYLVNNANEAQANTQINKKIAPIIPILNNSCISIYEHNGGYSIYLKPFLK